ncbi:MAG: hypothetical protein ACPLQP_01910 [Moorellaceae bacterium]
MAELFERLPGETTKAWAAFQVYRDLGPQRSLGKVREALGKSTGYMRVLEEWASKYQWVKRAAAYDDYLERKKREAQEKAVVKMAERQAKIALGFQEKIAQRLASLDPQELSPGDLARWFEVAVKVERLARGVPTETYRAEVETKQPVDKAVDKIIEEIRAVLSGCFQGARANG